VVETAQCRIAGRCRGPNSIFVTQLIATVEQDPQTSRRATAFDANAAYTANRHQGAGIRARQII